MAAMPDSFSDGFDGDESDRLLQPRPQPSSFSGKAPVMSVKPVATITEWASRPDCLAVFFDDAIWFQSAFCWAVASRGMVQLQGPGWCAARFRLFRCYPGCSLGDRPRVFLLYVCVRVLVSSLDFICPRLPPVLDTPSPTPSFQQFATLSNSLQTLSNSLQLSLTLSLHSPLPRFSSRPPPPPLPLPPPPPPPPPNHTTATRTPRRPTSTGTAATPSAGWTPSSGAPGSRWNRPRPASGAGWPPASS